MEENGIGRPSTYSTILNTLYGRKYAELDKKSIVPTDLGITVTDYLDKYFKDIVDAEFTAQMESKLDEVEEKGADWVAVVDDFYKPFIKEVNSAVKTGEKVVIEPELTDEICEKCGSRMCIKEGRYGKYLACTNYPECSNIRSLKKKEEPVMTDEICENAENPWSKGRENTENSSRAAVIPNVRISAPSKRRKNRWLRIFSAKSAGSLWSRETEDTENISLAAAIPSAGT